MQRIHFPYISTLITIYSNIKLLSHDSVSISIAHFCKHNRTVSRSKYHCAGIAEDFSFFSEARAWRFPVVLTGLRHSMCVGVGRSLQSFVEISRALITFLLTLHDSIWVNRVYELSALYLQLDFIDVLLSLSMRRYSREKCFETQSRLTCNVNYDWALMQRLRERKVVINTSINQSISAFGRCSANWTLVLFDNDIELQTMENNFEGLW